MNPRGQDPWDSRRRTAAWVNVGVQTILLLSLLVVVNLIARKSPSRIDLTSRRTYEISGLAADVLRRLDYDVEVWVNTDEYEATSDKSRKVALERTLELLREYQRRTPHLQVYPISPVSGVPRREVFQQHWTVLSPSTLYFLATLKPYRVNKMSLELYQLYQGNPVTGDLESYRGEAVLIQTLQQLGGAVKRIAYESEGHGEVVTADLRQMSLLGNLLTKNEGFEFRRVALNEYKTLPVDCDLLMIMAPSTGFVQNELDVIREYLDRGGSVLVAVRPRVRTGLEKLLADYGVSVGENLVHDPERCILPRTSDLFVKEFNLHEINRGMSNLQIRVPQTVRVDPIEKSVPDWRIVPLLMAGPGSWEQKGALTMERKAEPDKDLGYGDKKLAVAVEKPALQKQDEQHPKTRLVVWGSAAPFTNEVLNQEIQWHYVLNNFRWLTDRQSLDIPPQTIRVALLAMSPEAIGRVWWVVVVGFPAFGVALGFFVWFLRRA
jgi:ABC-type uncharacterized transport system involved in gliding motility auxiliary subunit